MTRMDDGTLVAPRRGNPPPEPPNYTRDPKDPYHFIPAFEVCKYREMNMFVLPCGKLSCNWFCTLKGITVNTAVCEDCDVDPKT